MCATCRLDNNMDILKSFVLDGTAYSVNVLWDDGKPFFRATEIGAVLGLKNVHDTIKDFDHDEKEERLTATRGGDQKITFLTEQGLYRLLMISRKPIARPFQKWVFSVLVAIRENGKYDLEKAVEELNAERQIRVETASKYDALARDFNDIADKSLHDSHIQSFANKYVVYFGKIRALDGDVNLIKIGSTKNIRSRVVGLAEEFGNMTLFHVIECDCHRQFESFLHQHKEIKKHAYKDVVHDGHRSSEVFALNEVDLRTAISIAQHNVHRFRKTSDIDEIMKIKHEMIMELKKQQSAGASSSSSAGASSSSDTTTAAAPSGDPRDDLYVDPVLLYADNRQYAHRGDKVQRYSLDGKTLLQTYDSMISALRDTALDAPSRTRIHQAVKDGAAYKDFRWMLLDRALPDDTVQVLGETEEKMIDIRKGFVAMLNLDQTKIVEVFPNQKEAGKDRQFKSSAPVCMSLKKGTQSGGHYFKMWFECSDDLKNEFLSRKELPAKVTPGGKSVVQLHPITNQVVRVYASQCDIIKEYRFSYTSLRNVINNKFIAKGYRWAWHS